MTLPSPADKPRFVERMFDAVAPRYDLMNRIMTVGIDRAWRREAVAALELRRGDVLVDLGCGTGDLCAEGARCGARPLGVDFSARMLAVAGERLPGLALLRADAGRLPLADASVDAVVSGFALRNFGSVAGVLGECGRVVRGGGRLALLEVDVPAGRVMKAGFDLYFHVVMPMLGRWVSHGYAYRYLSESIAYLPSQRELLVALDIAGFVEVRKTRLGGGAAQLVTALRGERCVALAGSVR